MNRQAMYDTSRKALCFWVTRDRFREVHEITEVEAREMVAESGIPQSIRVS